MANNINAFLNKKSYRNGYRYCARCGEFRTGWIINMKLCEDCHTKLRVKAKGGYARKEREPEIKRI